jgi:ketosteroid isomerase-like protein
MKTLFILAIFLGFGFLSGCKKQKEQPEVLVKILTDYFDGIKNQNLDKLNSLTTNDFVLFENGKIWTNDSLVTFKARFKSFKGEWKFDNLKVNVDESSGDIVYFDHGEFVFNDTVKMKFDWLESATFRKVDGKWKMNFLHSTVRK